MADEAEAILRVLLAAGDLKRVPRTGWVRTGVPAPESVADHSYRTALAALLLAPQCGADPGRAAAMALLHDLPEAVTGDLITQTPEERAAKLTREHEIMDGLLADFPGSEDLRGLWNDYRQGASAEARVVRSVDKLEMAVQALEEQRRNPQLDLQEFLSSARRGAEGPARTVLELVAQRFDATRAAQDPPEAAR